MISTDLLSSEHDLNIGKTINTGDTNLFLNRFDNSTIQEMMEKSGLTERLNKKGYNNLLIAINRDDANVHQLKLYHKSTSPGNMLIDLRISESRMVPDDQFSFAKKLGILDVFIIEWLSSENPKSDFSNKRPQLPGQKRPGLGALKYLVNMIHLAATYVFKDAFLDMPDHFHGAVMYSRDFKFFNPEQEAILRAILRDLKNYSLQDISWGLISGTVIDTRSGKPEVYKPSEQLFPVSDKLKQYFNSKKYQKIFTNTYKSKRYRMDYDAMIKIKNDILRKTPIVEL